MELQLEDKQYIQILGNAYLAGDLSKEAIIAITKDCIQDEDQRIQFLINIGAIKVVEG